MTKIIYKNNVRNISLITIFTILCLSCFNFSQITIVKAQTSPDSIFDPFNVQPVKFKVYDTSQISNIDPDKGLLATVDTSFGSGSASTIFRPLGTLGEEKGKKYPAIEVITSDPFPVDSTGKTMTTQEWAMTSPENEMKITAEGNKIYYLRKFYIAVDIGIRTRTNLPNYANYYDVALSPFDNKYYSHRGRIDYDAFDQSGGSVRLSEPHDIDVIWSLDDDLNSGIYDIDTRDGWEGEKMTATLKSELGYEHMPKDFPGEQDVEPIGVIGVYVQTGFDLAGQPWNVIYYNGGENNPLTQARITNSLVPLDIFDTDTFYQQSTTDESYRTEMDKIMRTEFGNSKVTVIPEITILLDQFKYDYTGELDDGRTIRIVSTNWEMGFTDIRSIIEFTRQGTINNFYNDSTWNEQVQAQLKASQELGKDFGTLDKTEDVSAFILKEQVDAHLKWEDTFKEIVTATANPMRTIRSTTDASQILGFDPDTVSDDTIESSTTNRLLINGEPIPKAIKFSIEADMAPETIVHYNRYDLLAQAKLRDPSFLGKNHLDTITYQRKIVYPSRVDIRNVYAISRVVMEVAVLSEIQGAIITTDGSAIKIEDWSDYELGSIGSIIDFDSFAAQGTTEEINLWQGLLDMLEFWKEYLIWIILAIVGIVGIIIYVVFKKIIGMIRLRRS